MIMEIGKPSLQVNELRIGNYVYNISTYSKGVCRIAAIDEEGRIKLQEGDKTYEKFIYPELIPIPLTEDILLNCGFESVDGDGERYNPNDEYKNSFEYRLDVGIFYRYLICKPALGWYVFIQHADLERKWGLRSKDIYFLHELQNLYFAITGEELEVKL